MPSNAMLVKSETGMGEWRVGVLVKKPIERSDARSVREANAVPIWQATIPANVIVVASTYEAWRAEPAETSAPLLQPASQGP